MASPSVTADAIDVEPHDAEISDTALDLLAVLLIDFVMGDEPS